MKGIQIRNEELKASLFADDVIVKKTLMTVPKNTIRDNEQIKLQDEKN